MPLTPPPEAPSTDDLENFDDEADAWLEYWELAVTELNALEANVDAKALQVEETKTEIEGLASDIEAAAMVAADAAGLAGKSNTSLTVGAGNKDIVLVSAKPDLMEVNRRVVLINRSDPTIKMFGTIAASPAPTSTTARVTVVSGGVIGSGTFGTWHVIDAAFLGSAATAAELWAQQTDAAAITPKTVKDGKVWIPLADGATVTPNGLNGRNFAWTIAADRTLAAITNCSVNDSFLIEITQNGTGGWDIAWNAAYKRVGGLPTLAQTAGQKTYLQVRVTAVDGSGTMTSSVVTAAANPTT